MDFFNWEFSKEVQSELNKFLQVVSEDKNEDCKLEKRFLDILPEWKALQSDLENSNIIIENNDESLVVNDVIVVEDDEDDIMETEIKTEIPDISYLNLTQAAIQQSEEELLNADVDVFIEYLLEYLENENLVLEKEYIVKLVNEYNNRSLNYIFIKLFEMSDNGVYQLNKSICKHADNPLNRVPELFCKIILFAKLQNLNPTNKLVSALKEFCDTFPEVTRQEIIILILAPHSGDSKFFQTIINMLSEAEKQNLLRDFVFMTNEIECEQLLILEGLLSSKTDEIVKRRLINLMEVSADKLKTEKLFIKLLVAIINNLETGFQDQEQIIFNIIEKSKTANKILAQKALNKWVNKSNEIL